MRISAVPLFPGAAALLIAVGLGVAPASAAGPLADAEGDYPGTRVEVLELKRSGGNTLTLKFAIQSDGTAKDVTFDSANFGESGMGDHGSVGGVHLLDSANKKKYLVVRDSEKVCVCSRAVPSIKPNARAMLWAKFPAPPESVEKISVVVPHFIPMDDVPIGK